MTNNSCKKTVLRILVISFTFFCTIFFISLNQKVHAQLLSLSIYPPILKAIMKPGKEIMIAYNIKNLGDPTTLQMLVLPFEPRDNLGNVRIKQEFEGPIRFSLDNTDIELNDPIFLKTGQSQQILLRIRVPEGAPEQDYYYTLFAQTDPSPTIEGKTSSRSKARIGSHILITVTKSGNVDIKGKVSLFSVLGKYNLPIFGNKISFFDSSDIIPITLIVENKGKNSIKPYGNIILRGNFGESAEYEILSQNILANSQRQLMATPSAYFSSEKPVSLALSGFFIGKYNLSTKINFGENTPQLYASTSFFALPFKFIIGSFIAIIIGIVIIKKLNSDKNDDEE